MGVELINHIQNIGVTVGLEIGGTTEEPAVAMAGFDCWLVHWATNAALTSYDEAGL